MTTRAARIDGIDFWRGLALIAILVDHVPGNVLEYVTPRNFGLSDSAEAFVFLSGLSVGAIYVARARKHGGVSIVISCLRRALKLYCAHIATTAAALALFFVTARVTGLGAILAQHGRMLIFVDPARGASGIAVLSHQIGYFNILPLYVALMIWAPLAVIATMLRPRLALAISVAIYAATRVFGWNLPTWPDDGHWFFNPLAWQLLFTAGVVFADEFRAERPRFNFAAALACALVLALGLITVTDALGFVPGLRDSFWRTFDVGKQDLGVMRLLHFFALAYLVASSAAMARLAASRFGEPLRRLGRHSLPVFVTGSMLSAVGQAATFAAGAFGSDPVAHAVALASTVAAIGGSLFLAARLDRGPMFPWLSAWLARRAADKQQLGELQSANPGA